MTRLRRRSSGRARDVDLTTTVGTVTLPNPVLTAAGTAGLGLELGAGAKLGSLGAHVVKSLSAEPWEGNPAPRLAGTATGMLNAVGLHNPGVAAWRQQILPDLAGMRVVGSIWGRTVDEFAAAAAALRGAPLVAVEVNLSCPNLEGRRGIFAHDPRLAAAVIDACAVAGLPRWAKLSANTDRVVEVAAAVAEAGAEAVTLINTLLGMVIDQDTLRPALGAGGGGYSGRGIHPVAVRCVYDVHAALPAVAIVGAGGVCDGWSAAELIAAGASAVEVGTASFADPRAARKTLADLARWCARRGLGSVAELIGSAHRPAR